MSERQHAVVVGGGIGGLAAAIGLRKAGWRASVLERAPGFTGIGAGISLMTNAMRALAELGVGVDLTASRTTGAMRTSTGRPLSRVSQERDGPEMLVLHRAELHRTLCAALPADSLRNNVEVTGVTTVDSCELLRVRTSDGDVDDADLVVAADGVSSRIRAQLWPEHGDAAYGGLTAWRAITDARWLPEGSLTLGPGSEFGIVPLGDGRVYWFGATVAEPGRRYADEHAAAQANFGHLPAPVGELIAATPQDAVLHHDILHLADPPPSFVSGRVALLGDAAHAMMPHLGQGGCQALEDAVELAAALGRLPVPDALARYDRRRRPRAQRIAAYSRRFGRIVRLRNPVAVAARTALLRMMPPGVGTRRTAKLLDWTPPVITGSNGHDG